MSVTLHPTRHWPVTKTLLPCTVTYGNQGYMAQQLWAVTWSQIESRDLSWSHVISAEVTRYQLESRDINWSHVISAEVTWYQLESRDNAGDLCHKSLSRFTLTDLYCNNLSEFTWRALKLWQNCNSLRIQEHNSIYLNCTQFQNSSRKRRWYSQNLILCVF